MKAASPYFKVLYNGKNITTDISKSLLSINYTDKSGGDADEIEITVEDVEGKWQDEWYPSKGATLSVEMGMEGGNILNCGVFTIDEISVSGSPDVVSMRGIAATISKSVRTKKSYPHENKTLKQIVQTVAQNHGFIVIGDIPDIKTEYVLQKNETDLAFLSRLAQTYGCTFNLRDNQVVFTDAGKLESGKSVITLTKSDISTYSFTNKTSGTYKAANLKHHNQKTNKVVKGGAGDDNIISDDESTLRVRAENKNQAEAKARAVLINANANERTGTFTMPGNTLILAGNNISMEGFGNNSGSYYLVSTTHSIDKSSGYSTSGEVKLGGVVKKIKTK